MSEPDEPIEQSQQSRPPELPSGFPLFLLAAALLIVAYLLSTGNLIRFQDRIPLWTLFMLAGLVAAIGGTVAFFFAEESPSSEEKDTDRSAAPYPSEPLQQSVELGRPRPEVRPRPPVDEPWREAWPDDEPPVRTRPVAPAPAAASAPSVPALPPSVRSRLDSALRELRDVSVELDSIERETSSRRQPKKLASR